MAGQAAPEVSKIAADQLHNQLLDGQRTVSQLANEVAANPDTSNIFSQYKRNYKEQYGADAERMRRQGLSPNQPPDLGAGPQAGL
jgi:hypothetical protein